MRIALSLIVSLIALYVIFFYDTSNKNLDTKSKQEIVKELNLHTEQLSDTSMVEDSVLENMDETEKKIFEETGYRRQSKDEVDKQQELLKGLMQKK